MDKRYHQTFGKAETLRIKFTKSRPKLSKEKGAVLTIGEQKDGPDAKVHFEDSEPAKLTI